MIRDIEINQLIYPANFDASKVSGILCLELFSESYSRFLCAQDLPVLFVDTAVNHSNLNLQADILYMENKTSSYLMLQSLVEKGCSHLSFVGDRYHCHSFFERWEAFCEIAKNYQLPIQEECCILDDDSSPYHEVSWMCDKIKQLPQLPDVFFCANDSLAIVILQALKQLSIPVPEKIKVCGFDDSPESIIVDPSLTTIKIPSTSMGYIASELMLSRISHKSLPFRTTYIKTDIIYRNSTKTQD